MGSTVTKLMEQDEFDKHFKRLAFEPCDRVISKLSGEAERYAYLVRSKVLADQLDPKAVEWSCYQHIGKLVTAYGCSSGSAYSFRRDLFQNLVNRLVVWLVSFRLVVNHAFDQEIFGWTDWS